MKSNSLVLTLLFAASFLVLSGCAPRDRRLMGRWKSNKELTIASIKYRKPMTPVKRAVFESVFGKLMLTYDRTHVTAEMPAMGRHPVWQNRIPYRVVGSDKNSVAIMSADPLTGESTIEHIYFEGPNRYWFYLFGTGWKEYFDRIPDR